MATSLSATDGAILLFDFAAAFPSVCHQFLFETLAALGLPEHVLFFIHAMYDHTACRLSLHGELFPGFVQSSGIRQGCPLSPILYAVLADSLLRALASGELGHVVRAFADDTALVTPSLATSLPVLQSLFHAFERASHLKLNVDKSVVIPLGDRSPARVSADLISSGDPWATLQCSGAGKYLGLFIGPEKANRSWEKPLAKFVQRLRVWDWKKVGLQGAAILYNTILLSVLLFVGQVEHPPKDAFDMELWALRRVAPGPYRWALATDLWRLRTAFGLPFRFRSLEWSCRAAQMRVYWQEAGTSGGLAVGQRVQQL